MKVEGYLTDTKKTHVTVDGFEYISDQPAEKGGENTGTSPHGFLVSSVVACKLMVAKGFLDHGEHKYERIEAEAESAISGGRRNETIDITVNMRVLGASLTETEEKHLNIIVEGGCTMANILTAGGKNTVSVNIAVE